jgi:predicted ATPase
LRRHVRRDITTAIDRSAAEAGFTLDPAQQAVRDRLLVLAEDLLAPGLRVLLISSNYAPASLLPNPLWRHIFEPGIVLILENVDIAQLAGTTDYRGPQAPGEAGFSSGAWVAPGTGDQLQRPGLATPRGAEQASIRVRSRDFEVAAVRPGELWCSFAQAYAAETSSIEFLDGTQRFERFILTGIPSFRDVDPGRPAAGSSIWWISSATPTRRPTSRQNWTTGSSAWTRRSVPRPSECSAGCSCSRGRMPDPAGPG